MDMFRRDLVVMAVAGLPALVLALALGVWAVLAVVALAGIAAVVTAVSGIASVLRST